MIIRRRFARCGFLSAIGAVASFVPAMGRSRRQRMNPQAFMMSFAGTFLPPINAPENT